MKYHQSHCPNCNASMTYSPSDGHYHCSYCGASFLPKDPVSSPAADAAGAAEQAAVQPGPVRRILRGLLSGISIGWTMLIIAYCLDGNVASFFEFLVMLTLAAPAVIVLVLIYRLRKAEQPKHHS